VIVSPIPLHGPHALAARLRAHGWTLESSMDAAGGVEPAAFLFEDVSDATLLALVRQAGQHGLECLTGDGWAVLAGSRARLGALARPWLLPTELQDLSTLLGRAMPGEAEPFWRTAAGLLPLDRPLVMGIVNTTPDSFSDGGRLDDAAAAVAHAERLVADGAAILDVGGESTRPGRAVVVPEAEEIARVVPVIAAIAKALPKVPISVDTVKGGVAAAALDAGAVIVNDVGGGRLDPALLVVAAERRAGYVLMHSRGENLELASATHARYDDPAGDVIRELGALADRAADAGVTREQLVLDPGIGFAKTAAQSLAVLDGLDGLRSLGRPVLVGPSRKRFLGAATGLPVGRRDGVTAVACALAWQRGARIFRVHAVAETVQALALCEAMRDPARAGDA
jgi:dihydropteroate synthase